jgi:hypothetical protein
VDLYCKIFVHGEVDLESLAGVAASITHGHIENHRVVSNSLDIDVEFNEDGDAHRFSADWDRFIHAPYYLDVEPAPNTDRDAYVKAVAALLEGLWGAGFAAVAAAEFEAELPRGGGLQRLPGPPHG